MAENDQICLAHVTHPQSAFASDTQISGVQTNELLFKKLFGDC